jgi:hypothetical protein
MGLVLSLSIVGVTVIALLIYFGLKVAVWKQFETETAGPRAGQVSSSSSTKQTLPGANAVQDQKASKEGERIEVLATSGGPSSGADARDNTRIAVAAPAAASSKTGPESPAKKEMWADSHYCWIVICKNGGFHRHTNLLFGHRIPLGETDAISPRLLSPGVSTFNAMSAAKSIPTKPTMYCGSNRSFLKLLHPIGYFEISRSNGTNPRRLFALYRAACFALRGYYWHGVIFSISPRRRLPAHERRSDLLSMSCR